ncbi:hypothetical protein RhiirA5_435957 [Rhizophagus irregularis]|uniref:Uncharacterized protein n=1 Tax=Rhizophagus irregularis TaxID=588596 RepID=A0A2N0NMM2_9GLOM|nr:hypothetical protein RhiirA5_435957 [Rhizophagus irregularis]GET50209.1 hypothetical protein RIR_jg32666.t1 [Rhizophagus irregularis DAOM 181602=DAOM 197198]
MRTFDRFLASIISLFWNLHAYRYENELQWIISTPTSFGSDSNDICFSLLLGQKMLEFLIGDPAGLLINGYFEKTT